VTTCLFLIIFFRVKEAAILKEALEKSREKRLLNTKMSGNTLGEAKEEGELLSAADWVRRSRKKEKDVLTEKEKAKLQAELAEKRLQEEEEENLRNDKYNSKDLKGMKVMHSVKDFDIGSEIILTLADSNILDKDEDGHVLGITGEADFLENVNMTDNDRRLEREKRAKRLKQPVYMAYDDAEFAEGGGPGTKQSILSQYDQDKKSAPKFELGEGGESQFSGEVIESKKTHQSLLIQAKEISDYYTKAEYTSFTKSKGDGKEKKKRKVRKKEEIEYADLDEEEGKVVTKDRGSRKIGGDSAAVISTRMVDKKKEIYKEASKNAEEKSLKAFKMLENILPEEDDDADMALSLARARRLALAHQQYNKDSISLEDVAAMRVKELVARSQNASLLNESKSRLDGSKNVKAAFDIDNATGRTVNGVPSSKIDDGELELEEDSLDAEGRRADGTLVFTSTTEFTSRLQARLTEKARARAEAIVKAEAGSEQQMQIQIEDELGNIPMEGSSGRVYQRAEGTVDGEGRDEWVTMDVEGLEDADSDEEEELDFGRQQSFTGMAATLALLKSSGELGKSEDLAGRAKDGRVNDPSNKVDGVKLEYRDEFGRKLTQKEAFRQICYRFHGYGPGKKAKEKRLKQMEDQSKALSSRY
jgi:U4/U6.U5 tri-snRNP-associated protein 1